MKQLYILIGIFLFTLNQSQVGIGTNTPDASAILEISATNKGFKAPNVKLLSTSDVTTISSPQAGLLVFNTDAAGTFPTNVVANEYYFFNGTKWMNIASSRQVEELLIPGMYVLSESTTQTFPSINDILVYQPVVFSTSTPTINKGNIITKSGSIFTVNRSGLYEVTANVNYNPSRAVDSFVFSLLNISIQSRKGGTTTWNNRALARRSWGNGSTDSYQTAFVPNFCIYLDAGDEVQLAITNPLAGPGLQHGVGQVSASATMPISKSISLQLINY